MRPAGASPAATPGRVMGAQPARRRAVSCPDGKDLTDASSAHERGPMASMRPTFARVPEDLEAAARKRTPELAAVDFSTLVRTGLAVLAGHPLPEAITAATACRQRPGPQPGTPRPRRVSAAAGGDG
jgi:hypothetical protein